MLPLAVKKTPHLLHVELAIFLRHFVCCFYSSSFLPTVYRQHDDLRPAGQPITAVVFHQTRGFYLGVQGGEFDPQFSHCILEKKMLTPCYFYITVAYDLYAFVVFDMWILLCNAASSQCSPRCYSDSEKKKISRTDIFWLDMPVVSLQTGGSDSVQCYEAWKHCPRGKGRG